MTFSKKNPKGKKRSKMIFFKNPFNTWGKSQIHLLLPKKMWNMWKKSFLSIFFPLDFSLKMSIFSDFSGEKTLKNDFFSKILLTHGVKVKSIHFRQKKCETCEKNHFWAFFSLWIFLWKCQFLTTFQGKKRSKMIFEKNPFNTWGKSQFHPLSPKKNVKHVKNVTSVHKRAMCCLSGLLLLILNFKKGFLSFFSVFYPKMANI